MLVQNFVERLRPLVGFNSWDYIVLWKLSDDHRHLELMSCICAGTQSVQTNGEELVFPASSARSCRDVFFSHPRIKPCDLLDHVPSSIALDSGVHAEVLLSNHACWLNFAYNLDSNASEETIGTRVLVPTPLGLLELFVTKQVPEDQGLVDFIKTQCNIFLEQHAMNNSASEDSRFTVNGNGIHEIPSNLFPSDANFSHDISLDRIHLGSPFNPSQINSTSEIMNKNKSILVEGTFESDSFTPLSENGFHEMGTSRMRRNASKLSTWMESSRSMEDCNNEKISSFTEENNKSDDSDPNDDEENDVKYRKRNGKGHQSKNLEAERKRRKKLNDRLYRLRALVPNISKLDRSAILGDAIDYVKELLQQVSDLQLELEERSDDENAKIKDRSAGTDKCIPLHQNGTRRCPKRENENLSSGYHKGSSGNGGITNSFKQNSEVENMNDKVQQMEPQVEVLQLDGNEFYIKVFCEHKPGGFLRLMEALNYLGLEVRNVNTTRHTCLVSNIFRVEIRENETVQADYVKESLLELTRNPLTEWPYMGQASYNGENRF